LRSGSLPVCSRDNLGGDVEVFAEVLYASVSLNGDLDGVPMPESVRV
jgi:hypothetical protein